MEKINSFEAKTLYAAMIKNAFDDMKKNDITSAMWLLSEDALAACKWIGFDHNAIAKTVGEMVFGGD